MFEFKEEMVIEEEQESSSNHKISPYVNRKLTRIKNLAEQVDYCVEDNNFSQLDLVNEQLVKESIFLCDHIKRFTAGTGNMDVLRQALDSVVGVQIEMESQICHVTFDGLLPYRLKNNAASDNSTIQQTYVKAIYDKAKEISLSLYKCKVIMCFVHIYKSKNDMKDHDNYEYKPIIDALALHLLHDDKPQYCAHYMDYLMGDSNHTEVYIVPEYLFPAFLEQINSKRQ